MRKYLPFAVILLAVLSCGKEEETPDGPGVQPEKITRTVSSAEEFEAFNTMMPGDVYVWKDGTYKDAKIDIYGKGTPEKPILLRAETPGGVILTGDPQIIFHGTNITVSGFRMESLLSSSKNYRVQFLETSSQCTLRECRIDGSTVTPTNSSLKTKWVVVKGEENRVTQCSFLDMRSFGVLLEIFPTEKPCRHLVDHNHFTHPYSYVNDSGSPLNGQEIIRIGTSSSDMYDAACTVRDNYFYNCVAEQGEVISNKSWGNTYEGNLLEQCFGTLCLRQGGRCTVKGNFFVGKGAATGDRHIGGVRIIGPDHLVQGNTFVDLSGDGYNSAMCIMKGDAEAITAAYLPVRNVKILDNFFFDCKYAFYINVGPETASVAPSGVEISGNRIMCSDNSWYSIFVRDAMDERGIKWENNTIWGGTQKGITAKPTVAVKPDYKRWSEDIIAIRRGAGVSWK